MNIDISEVRNKRFIHISHLVIYLFMIGYGVMSIFQYRLENLPINISVITSFLFFFLVELFTRKKRWTGSLDPDLTFPIISSGFCQTLSCTLYHQIKYMDLFFSY